MIKPDYTMEIVKREKIEIWAIRVETKHGMVLVQFEHEPTDDEITNYVRDAIRNKAKSEHEKD